MHRLTICAWVQAGAELSRLTGLHMSAVHLAARGCHAEVLSMLLEHAARINTELINSRDEDGRTPLFVCSSSERQAGVNILPEIRCLLSAFRSKFISFFDKIFLPG